MGAEPARRLQPVPDRLDALALSARRAANMLGLRDWTVLVDEDPPADPAANADVRVDVRRRALALRVREDFHLLPEDEQRHSLAHELVHVHLELLAQRVMSLSDEFGRTAWNVFWSGYEQETERAVDALAGVIAPLLPEIEWE